MSNPYLDDLHDEVYKLNNVIKTLLSMLKATGMSSELLDNVVKEAYNKPIN